MVFRSVHAMRSEALYCVIAKFLKINAHAAVTVPLRCGGNTRVGDTTQSIGHAQGRFVIKK